jgi:ribonuclease BN (tRNA processing enzyme)
VKGSIELDIEYKEYFKVYDCNVFNVNEVQYYKENLLLDNPNENFVDIAKLSPINDYQKLCEKINAFRNKPELKPIYEDFLNKFGALFNTIEVFHCEESFGFFIENNLSKEDPLYYKISFSGDTRPNNNFFNYSMHSTLFIHEGTFDSDMTEDAEEKMHSTVGQAIDIGENNLSKYIALTHFSPRYIKTYPYKEEFDKKKILFTNDYLSFYLYELPVAYKYLKSFDEIINAIEGNKKKKNIL